MRVRILVIDDEESICEILRYNLEKEGYEVDIALSAEDALAKDPRVYSLFIVDIMMDKMSGFDLVRRLKNDVVTENTPVIFCSALSGEDDTVMGLNIGADDYITKPFSIPEVLARVRSVLRRSQINMQQQHVSISPGPHHRVPRYESDIVFEELRLDRNSKTCSLRDEALPLSRTEFDLLLFFMTHRNRIFSRHEIISHVWDSSVVITDRTVDTNLTRLRKKLGDYGRHIATRIGFGYGFSEKV